MEIYFCTIFFFLWACELITKEWIAMEQNCYPHFPLDFLLLRMAFLNLRCTMMCRCYDHYLMIYPKWIACFRPYFFSRLHFFPLHAWLFMTWISISNVLDEQPIFQLNSSIEKIKKEVTLFLLVHWCCILCTRHSVHNVVMNINIPDSL